MKSAKINLPEVKGRNPTQVNKQRKVIFSSVLLSGEVLLSYSSHVPCNAFIYCITALYQGVEELHILAPCTVLMLNVKFTVFHTIFCIPWSNNFPHWLPHLIYKLNLPHFLNLFPVLFLNTFTIKNLGPFLWKIVWTISHKTLFMEDFGHYLRNENIYTKVWLAFSLVQNSLNLLDCNLGPLSKNGKVTVSCEYSQSTTVSPTKWVINRVNPQIFGELFWQLDESSARFKGYGMCRMCTMLTRRWWGASTLL